MRLRHLSSILTIAGLFVVQTAQARAEQFALVVGIDDYIHLKPPAQARADGDPIGDLLGAENDAKEIAQALLSRSVDLPPSRILLSRDATLANFLAAWRQMVDQASAGDTLIVSFAGHGGQETEVAEPKDEADGRDETIMFADFNPESPREGRLNDDQLRNLLVEAAQFSILWVMDSCHSGGLERSIGEGSAGLSRNGGNWNISVEPLAQEIEASVGDNDANLAHVTQILATATDERVVTETVFQGRPHGALSYFFAQAVAGAADVNQDLFISRLELSNYLDTQIVAHMNQNQKPRILPRGDRSIALSLGEERAPEQQTPEVETLIRVHVQAAEHPFLFSPNVILVEDAADLTLRKAAGGWDVFNHTGDRITLLPDGKVDGINKIIARAELMKAFPGLIRTDRPFGKILPGQPPVLQNIGDLVGFRFIPPSPKMRFLTIFNLAGDGTFQYLHPGLSDQSMIAEQGLSISFKVTQPTGVDQLVGVYCTHEPTTFQNFLIQHDQGVPPAPAEFEAYFRKADCQLGRTGLYTTD